MTSTCLVFVLLLTTAPPAEAARPEPREQIGTVLDEPIYRDQFRKEFPVRSELFRLINPALDQYRQQHRDEIDPTDAELKFVGDYFRKQDPDRWKERDAEWKTRLEEVNRQLAKPDLDDKEREQLILRKEYLTTTDPAQAFAKFILGSWKFNRHLYETFGGGRIVWQQAGVEAFDATLRWLETLEKNGDFSITDPELRATFYEYWTNEKQHRSFMSTPEKNPERIAEFLNPKWMLADDAK